MATSTLKAVILVAVVLLGALALRSAFPANVSETIAPPPSSPPAGAVTTSPPTGGSPSPSPTETRNPRKRRTTVQVLNGTDDTGFAGEWTNIVQDDGWRVTDPGNANTTQTTRILYRPDFLIEAQALQAQFFPTAQLQDATGSAAVPEDVEIQIILGADAPPAPSPSP